MEKKKPKKQPPSRRGGFLMLFRKGTALPRKAVVAEEEAVALWDR